MSRSDPVSCKDGDQVIAVALFAVCARHGGRCSANTVAVAVAVRDRSTENTKLSLVALNKTKKNMFISLNGFIA